MIFKLVTKKTGKISFCGVHTFDGQDNNVSLPDWLMKQLEVDFGDKIEVSYVVSPVATGKFAKFQPMTKFFFTIPNYFTNYIHSLPNHLKANTGRDKLKQSQELARTCG